MKILRRETASRYRRDGGTTSHLLASSRTCGATHLTTTLVDIEPGGAQQVHQHAPEQVYFILEGSGAMTVGGETRVVGLGDCIFVPSGSPHGITNRGNGMLRYFSASAPAFDPAELSMLWPLQSERDQQNEES